MKHILFLSLISLVTACGNPHISSVRNNIDDIVSPLNEEECAEALSEVRTYTEQEQFQSVAECQEQEQQEQQAQQQQQEEWKTSWQFEKPVVKFETTIPEVIGTAIISAEDCNGVVVLEKELSSGTRYVGVIGQLELCSLSVAY